MTFYVYRKRIMQFEHMYINIYVYIYDYPLITYF